MLENFFRINLPYGMIRNDKNEWMCFNREYMPLGYVDTDFKKSMSGMYPNYTDLPIYAAYMGLTEFILIRLADRSPDSIRRDLDGKICQVFFYDDGTNPTNAKDKKHSNFLYETYFEKLKVLSELKSFKVQR